jgi:hypothetical protein
MTMKGRRFLPEILLQLARKISPSWTFFSIYKGTDRIKQHTISDTLQINEEARIAAPMSDSGRRFKIHVFRHLLQINDEARISAPLSDSLWRWKVHVSSLWSSLMMWWAN